MLTQSTRPARSLFRLLPATVFAASLLLALKVVEIVQTGKQFTDAMFVERAVAQQQGESPIASILASIAASAPATPPAAEEKTEEQATEGEEEKAIELPPGVSTEPPAATPAGAGRDVPDATQGYNSRELGILESLSARRERIEQMERDLSLREKVLEAAEQRIDTKLAELKEVNEEVKEMLVVQGKEEETKITSLVKIYEAMKPKDAARIFDEMDMDVLLMVAGRMSERRVAPVLAAMSPEKAKDVTQELAAKQKADRAVVEATQEKMTSPPF